VSQQAVTAAPPGFGDGAALDVVTRGAQVLRADVAAQDQHITSRILDNPSVQPESQRRGHLPERLSTMSGTAPVSERHSALSRR